MNYKMAVYHGARDVEIKEAPIPVCGEKDILIQNLYAAICGTDLHAYQREGESVRIYDGYEFGHEMVSRVAAVGSAVTNFRVGDIVYPYPMTARGRGRSCTVGGFSEYILIEGCELNNHVYKVPAEIDLKVAALIEPFTVGTRAARRARPAAGESAIVFGAGAIGMSAAIALKYFGCGKVMLVDFSDFRLNKAKEIGFEVCNSKNEDLKKKAVALFGETYGVNGPTANVDILIDAVGAAPVIDSCLSLLKVYGKMVVVGIHGKPVATDWRTITYSQADVYGSGGYTPEDVRDVLEIMCSKKYPLEEMVTHEFRLDEIDTAFETAADANSSIKVLISYVERK